VNAGSGERKEDTGEGSKRTQKFLRKIKSWREGVKAGGGKK